MIKKLLVKTANVPIIWNSLQYFVGANQWKFTMYPSVFGEKKGRLLDFGCSVGNTTAAFLDFDYVGIDVDPEAIKGAQARYAGVPHVKFYALDILKDPMPERDFDHVLFAAAGHHISDADLTAVIDRLLSCLKPGGSLHFFDLFKQPGTDSFTTRLLCRFDQGKFIRTKERYGEIFADKKYNIQEKKVFKSPDGWLIKQQDFIYFKLQR